MTHPVEFSIYTDGGYFEKQDLGGWGSVIYQQGQELLRQSDWQKHTSSLEMELKAAVKGLESLQSYLQTEQLPLSPPAQFQITLFTDSRILIEGLSEKITHWRLNNWIHKSGNRVKYQTLWEMLESLTQQLQVKWQWVKGHNGNLGNTIADQLARKAVMQRLQETY
ncbi:MAG: ribonuclease HI [Thiomicrorhabdus sp.]|nr:MAG: ribonuclease HI [Thiomicrorhabdus sp.]